ncbi:MULTISPECIES: HAMP domain-containing sensor histidine kinase [unclassified Mesorhizobium]|uniref:sensor histidine kinase n=1 Tax=unclassified Mesorhizobium TaxID=325217 RepID=UPI000BB0C08B|nr:MULTISPECIES: HAMP domain-containing sensor histidine kinase [unclassified Mesorhizobium]TGT53527.1 HAMP domain-containing histidine kinase [Mesorhizobium sp. M00.F.Ca.ET.170.01.1.1]AZO10584.1 HAMP domain-containing histidine kinase [Mesorhizobium sp. M3A.F.Ca.ET.080.04.2.1]PBB88083.1 two-component sensor histidine kinase [Mesorhizobium sp. WSM3876]RWB66826.1 MAG: HAMP domain-containing histidine kinase [Mesorhizobium sp.]RWB84109.1 MAG: HAMP domain-containing histidine kinase [Mesorhizobiu
MRWLSKEKWRPRLATVVVAILIVVMALPLVGLFFFRLYENQLIRQTEAELIAQGAALAAIYAREVRDAGIAQDRLGPPVPSDAASARDYPYHPIEPRLDLAADDVLPTRPPGLPAAADPGFAAIGVRLSGMLEEIQKTTLAGFRLLDPRGVVIAGRSEVGQSLGEVEEVRQALAGRYASELRLRIPDQPPPPLYSVSRGTRVRVFVAMPVEVEGRVAGVVYLSRTPNNIIKHLYGERGKVTLAAIAMLGGTLLIALMFIRTVSRPIYALIERTKRIAVGDREAMRPLDHHGTREMAELSAAFLDMAGKLQARSDSIQTFATHVSHELKSPLTAIQGAAELLRDSGGTMDEAERQRFANNIVTDAGRLNLLVRRLLELARAENLAPSGESTTPSAALALLPVDTRLEVRIEAGGEVAVGISGENLAIVIANLIDNSARHGAKLVSIKAAVAGGRVVVHIGDDGDGISPSNRAKVFEPFFTTRRESGGTGMGLGIVLALLKAHDGTIRLVDSERGTRFEISLPLSS